MADDLSEHAIAFPARDAHCRYANNGDCDEQGDQRISEIARRADRASVLRPIKVPTFRANATNDPVTPVATVLMVIRPSSTGAIDWALQNEYRVRRSPPVAFRNLEVLQSRAAVSVANGFFGAFQACGCC